MLLVNRSRFVTPNGQRIVEQESARSSMYLSESYSLILLNSAGKARFCPSVLYLVMTYEIDCPARSFRPSLANFVDASTESCLCELYSSRFFESRRVISSSTGATSCFSNLLANSSKMSMHSVRAPFLSYSGFSHFERALNIND